MKGEMSRQEIQIALIAVYGKAKRGEIHLPEPFKAEHLLRLSRSPLEFTRVE